MLSGPNEIPRKSRNGCIRCKERRVKCDEAKPKCQKCADKNFFCPGYVQNLRWSKKHEFKRQRRAQVGTTHGVHQLDDLGSANALRADYDDNPQASDPVNSHSILAHTEALALFPLDSDWTSSAASWKSALPDIEAVAGWADIASNHVPILSPATVTDQNPKILLSDRNLLMHNSSTGASSLIAGENVVLSTGEDAPSPSSSDIDFTQFVVNALSPPAKTRCLNSTAILMAKSPLNIRAPSRKPPPTPHMMISRPDILVPHFFEEVLPLYCCFDSELNNLRHSFQRLWQSSEILFHTAQSMAAACLASQFPSLKRHAILEYETAIKSLQGRLAISLAPQDAILGLLVLGQSASWHRPTNLALNLYKTTRERLWQSLSCADSNIEDYSFLVGALEYWGMLLAFFTDQGTHYQARHLTDPTGPNCLNNPIFPHPWSGASSSSVRILFKVGALVFRTRKHTAGLQFMCQSDLQTFRLDLSEAEHLERSLLSHNVSNPHMLMDPGDSRTTLEDMQKIDEAYRSLGLLQLYRVFPDLLIRRYVPWSDGNLLIPALHPSPSTIEARNIWLTHLSMHILDLLRSISFESGTRCMQPFILVAASSELRPNASEDNDTAFVLRVANARKFVMARLSGYSHVLPLPKIQLICDLVQTIWRQIDAGNKNAYWVDIALGQGMATMMG